MDNSNGFFENSAPDYANNVNEKIGMKSPVKNDARFFGLKGEINRITVERKEINNTKGLSWEVKSIITPPASPVRQSINNESTNTNVYKDTFLRGTKEENMSNFSAVNKDDNNNKVVRIGLNETGSSELNQTLSSNGAFKSPNNSDRYSFKESLDNSNEANGELEGILRYSPKKSDKKTSGISIDDKNLNNSNNGRDNTSFKSQDKEKRNDSNNFTDQDTTRNNASFVANNNVDYPGDNMSKNIDLVNVKSVYIQEHDEHIEKTDRKDNTVSEDVPIKTNQDCNVKSSIFLNETSSKEKSNYIKDTKCNFSVSTDQQNRDTDKDRGKSSDSSNAHKTNKLSGELANTVSFDSFCSSFRSLEKSINPNTNNGDNSLSKPVKVLESIYEGSFDSFGDASFEKTIEPFNSPIGRSSGNITSPVNSANCESPEKAINVGSNNTYTNSIKKVVSINNNNNEMFESTVINKDNNDNLHKDAPDINDKMPVSGDVNIDKNGMDIRDITKNNSLSESHNSEKNGGTIKPDESKEHSSVIFKENMNITNKSQSSQGDVSLQSKGKDYVESNVTDLEKCLKTDSFENESGVPSSPKLTRVCDGENNDIAYNFRNIESPDKTLKDLSENKESFDVTKAEEPIHDEDNETRYRMMVETLNEVDTITIQGKENESSTCNSPKEQKAVSKTLIEQVLVDGIDNISDELRDELIRMADETKSKGKIMTYETHRKNSFSGRNFARKKRFSLEASFRPKEPAYSVRKRSRRFTIALATQDCNDNENIMCNTQDEIDIRRDNDRRRSWNEKKFLERVENSDKKLFFPTDPGHSLRAPKRVQAFKPPVKEEVVPVAARNYGTSELNQAAELLKRGEYPDPDMRSQLDSYIENIIKCLAIKGDYVKAAEYQKLQDFLKSYADHDPSRKERDTRGQEIKIKLERAKEVYQNLINHFLAAVDSQKQSNEKRLEIVRRNHQKEIEEFEAHWSNPDFLHTFTKPSGRLLYLRQTEMHLVAAKQFEKAIAIKMQADKLQKQETALAREKAIAAMNAAYQKLIANQAKEITIAKQRGDLSIKSIENERERKLNAQMIVVRRLENTHNTEKRTIERFQRTKPIKVSDLNFNVALDIGDLAVKSMIKKQNEILMRENPPRVPKKRKDFET